MKKFNAFAGASQAYEAPEIETIEVRMEQSIASGCLAEACGGAEGEDVCEDCTRD